MYIVATLLNSALFFDVLNTQLFCFAFLILWFLLALINVYKLSKYLRGEVKQNPCLKCYYMLYLNLIRSAPVCVCVCVPWWCSG